MIDDTMIDDSDPYQHEIVIDSDISVEQGKSPSKIFTALHAVSLLFMILLGFMTAKTTVSQEEFYKSFILYIAEAIIMLVISIFFNSFSFSSHFRTLALFFLGAAASSIIFYII